MIECASEQTKLILVRSQMNELVNFNIEMSEWKKDEWMSLVYVM